MLGRIKVIEGTTRRTEPSRVPCEAARLQLHPLTPVSLRERTAICRGKNPFASPNKSLIGVSSSSEADSDHVRVVSFLDYEVDAPTVSAT